MTMLEKAARALWETVAFGDRTPWERGPHNHFSKQVSAVLRAIRAPDERVLEAMAEREANEVGCRAECTAGAMITGGCPCAAHALAVWQAGIDAVMEERHD